MGITGVSADEAMKTIQGSIAMTKAAWTNLLVGLADESADVNKLVGNLVESATYAIGNVGKRIAQVLPQISTALSSTFKGLQKTIIKTFQQIAPAAVKAITNVAQLIVPIL